jgi:hypothetical protein
VSGIDLSDLFVKPVPGRDDVVAFQFDFVAEGKALDEGGTAPLVTEQENGDLIIEGYAAVFEGDDREGENFADTKALEQGIDRFVNGQAGLCYHHKHDKLLGKVLELGRVEGKGLRMKARVDGAIRKHPELGTYYEQIKNGSLNALSIGGFFKRAIVGGLQKITVTPVPVHPGTNFAVVAGKALSDLKVPEVPNVGEVREQDERQIAYLLEELTAVFDSLEKSVAARTTTNAAEATT